MSSNDKTYKDEINLIEEFKTIWESKTKIIIIIIVCTFCGFLFNKSQPNPTYKSTTEIKPLKENQLSFFDLYNTTDVYEINSLSLFNNYIDTLNQSIVLQNTIKKFGIISKENYENDESYDEAVLKASSEIRIIGNLDLVNKKNPHITLGGTDKDKLLDIIKFIISENNKVSIQNLKKEFRNKVSTLRELDKLRKEDVQYQIQNSKDVYDTQIKKTLQQIDFEIEDVNQKIENSYEDYLFTNEKRLKYLKEQSSIARKLDIAILTADNKGGPFYVVGYVAINKEIEIIENRKSIKRYEVSETLLRKQRTLRQDKTLIRKEKNKLYLQEILILTKDLRNIARNEVLYKRAEVLFKKSLDKISDNFESVEVDLYATTFTSKSKTRLSRTLIITIIFGGLLGLLYVIIEKKIKRGF